MLIEQQACGTLTPPLTNLPDPNSLKQGMHVLIIMLPIKP
jgi:hypothetical protein